MQDYPQSKLILADALAAILAWAALLACMATFSVGLATSFEIDHLLKLTGIIFAISSAAHIVLALLHSCPNCRKHPTAQSFSPLHEDAKSIGGMDGWTSVVWSVAKHRKFTCIHCGTKHRVAA